MHPDKIHKISEGLVEDAHLTQLKSYDYQLEGNSADGSKILLDFRKCNEVQWIAWNISLIAISPQVTQIDNFLLLYIL